MVHRVYSKQREEAYTVVVDWNLGNTCSLKCDYCHPGFKNGSNPFPDIDKAKLFIDKLTATTRESNRTMRFSFVGGEPTEYDHLVDLCHHIKSNGRHMVHVMSNAAKPESYWRTLSPNIDSAALTFHAGKVPFKHFLAVCEHLRASMTATTPIFAMHPDTFEQSWYELERMRTIGYAPVAQPLYLDHARRQRLFPYTDDQLSRLFPKINSGEITVESETKPTETHSVDSAIHEKKNSFTGMKCGIGIDQLTIDQGGNIRGGWCGVGGLLGNINEGDFVPPTEPVICTKDVCSNPLDLSVPKWVD